MKTPLPLPALATLFFLLLTGCATPQKRIEANPDLFASFPAEAREKIQTGEIALGFAPDMVRMAKGDPNSVFTRTTADGTTTVWSYTRTEIHTRVHPVHITDRGRGAFPSFIETDETRVIETLRVEFRNGEVVAFEERNS